MKNSTTSADLLHAMKSATRRWNGGGKWTRESRKVAIVRTTSAIQMVQYRLAPAWCMRSCSARESAVVLAMAAASDQVEQRVEEDPDEVDEVPVHAAELDRRRVAGVVDAPPALHHQDREHRHPDDDVEAVEPGEDEVEREEHGRAHGLQLLRRVEAPGQQALVIVVAPLPRLDAEEDHAEAERDEQRQRRRSPAAVVGMVVAEGDGEAGGDQDQRVDGARRDAEVLARQREGGRVQEPVHGVRGEEAAEQQQLRREEEPHPEPRRVLL